MQAQGEDVSEQIAGRDLKYLSDRGLLLPHGEKRGRHYTAGRPVRELMQRVRETRDVRDNRDPFADCLGPSGGNLESRRGAG
jgi:hypothetical protein